MLFRSIATVFSSVLFTQGALAALTPAQVVTNIGVVTTVSGDINTALTGLSVTPTSKQLSDMSQTVVTGFNTIVSDLAGDTTAMKATPAFGAADAQSVADALRDFVAVHQALLSTVIGKHSIFAQFGVTAPIAAVLRSLEAGIDSFAEAMINLIPTQSADVTTDKNSLDSSVSNAITTYVQICLPSVLYPTLQPICASL